MLRDKIVGVFSKLLTEGYLEISIPVLISISGFKAQNQDDWVALVAQYAFLGLFALPFAIIFFMCSNFEDLGDETFRANYGLLYKDLKIRTKL